MAEQAEASPDCPFCGAAGQSGHFCSNCGRRLSEPEAPVPKAVDFARRLRSEVTTPGVVLVVGAALIAAAVLWGLGLLMSLLPESSNLGDSTQVGPGRFAFGRAAELTMANLHARHFGLSLREVPALLLVLPLAAVAVPAALLAGGTRGVPVRTRLLLGAAIGPVFGLLMLFCALAAGNLGEAGDPTAVVKVSQGGAFVLGTLWGGLAGVAGVAWALRREGVAPSPARLPPWAPRARRLAWVALRPLLAVLALYAVLGTGVWIVQSARDAGAQRTLLDSRRSTATTIFDDLTFAADNGLHLFELGSAVGFHQPGVFGANGMPVPVTKVKAVAGPFSLAGAETRSEVRAVFEPPGTFRIFDYSDGLRGWAFVVLLGVLVPCALAAAYGGFALARAARAQTPARAAGWGALLGPIWAVALLLLNALVQKQIGGKADGDDVLVVYLFVGAALGALGGLLAVSGEPPEPEDGAEATGSEAVPPPPGAGEAPSPRGGRLWSE